MAHVFPKMFLLASVVTLAAHAETATSFARDPKVVGGFVNQTSATVKNDQLTIVLQTTLQASIDRKGFGKNFAAPSIGKIRLTTNVGAENPSLTDYKTGGTPVILNLRRNLGLINLARYNRGETIRVTLLAIHTIDAKECYFDTRYVIFRPNLTERCYFPTVLKVTLNRDRVVSVSEQTNQL